MTKDISFIMTFLKFLISAGEIPTVHSSRRGWQNLLGNFWISVQILTFWTVLDVFWWNKSFKLSLNDDLCIFKSSKNLKINHFWWFLVEITVSCKEYWVHTYGTWCIFFHLPNVKKTWEFHSLPFGGTVLSPPPYITRPLCTVNLCTPFVHQELKFPTTIVQLQLYCNLNVSAIFN